MRKMTALKILEEWATTAVVSTLSLLHHFLFQLSHKLCVGVMQAHIHWNGG